MFSEWPKARAIFFAASVYRLLAVAWIAKGLVAWCLVLGISVPFMAPLETYHVLDQSLVMMFSVVDIVAGVGLWLSPRWGGVVWLIAVLAECVRQFTAQPSLFREFSLATLITVFAMYALLRHTNIFFRKGR